MPVPNLTYVYIILLASDVLWIVIAALHRDEEKLEVFIPSVFLFFIGFLSNLNSTPKLFNLNGF